MMMLSWLYFLCLSFCSSLGMLSIFPLFTTVCFITFPLHYIDSQKILVERIIAQVHGWRMHNFMLQCRVSSQAWSSFRRSFPTRGRVFLASPSLSSSFCLPFMSLCEGLLSAGVREIRGMACTSEYHVERNETIWRIPYIIIPFNNCSMFWKVI